MEQTSTFIETTPIETNDLQKPTEASQSVTEIVQLERTPKKELSEAKKQALAKAREKTVIARKEQAEMRKQQKLNAKTECLQKDEESASLAELPDCRALCLGTDLGSRISISSSDEVSCC